MNTIRAGLSCLALVVAAGLCGCESTNQPNASQNASLASPYEAGSGVSSSGYNSKPRFYTGPNGTNDQAPSTQAASR